MLFCLLLGTVEFFSSVHTSSLAFSCCAELHHNDRSLCPLPMPPATACWVGSQREVRVLCSNSASVFSKSLVPSPWEWVSSQHSCPSFLWQPNPDLYLWLVLRGSFLPLLHWQEAFNGNGIKSWSSGLNPVPPKSRGFFLPWPSSNESLHVPSVDRVFCSPQWLRPFLLLLREGPRQGEARFHDFPMPPSFACLQTQGGATEVHASQVFLMNTGWVFGFFFLGWSFWEELVCACTVPQYLRLPGVLYCHVSFSLAFSNSLIF